MHLSRLAALAAVCLALPFAGCSTLSTLSGTSITQSQVDVARNAYDGAFLAPAARYRQLGYCASGTFATLAKPCASRTVVAQLQAADQTVEAAFVAVQAQINAGNTTGITAAYSTLTTVIAAAENLALTFGVK